MIFIFVASMFSFKTTSQVKNQQPNFIFIMVDDLGKEWISSYGASEIETPNIDQIAATGIKFNNAYSMPQCTPSRVALITGQYPYSNGWVSHFDVPRWGLGVNFDADKNPSFAKVLQQSGYKTGIAGKWQINDFRIEPKAMEKAGFDAFCMWTGYESGNKPSENRYWDPYIYTKEGSKTYKGQFGPDIFSDFIIDFINNNKDNPFCVYYPMVLTHTPFVHTPHEPHVKTNYEKHQAMVRYTDFIIGKIVKSLEDSGLMDNTYLIFTTDNGTAPYIVGKRNGVYMRGGKAFLTENGINAPFIVSTPSKNHFESDALIDFTDVYPTLLELAGIKKDSNVAIDGHSFADVLSGKTKKSQRDYTLSMGGLPAGIDEEGRMQNAFVFRDRVLRNEKFKVYVDSLKQVIRLFDMEKDPYETKNLIENKSYRKVVKQFNNYVNTLPNADANPKYNKIEGLPSDEDPEVLNKAAKRSKNRKTNMMPLATKEEFLKVSSKTN
ncbi:sulfatase-like hydrolase/transferase [Mariniflexile gromovii]|uniref:Sulfatase-like hydrolase/transferase n=1 Tax=Mariniflexile gromovii TaxID=362523 RepID=A0ABS4BQY2_9FLAO|nr:sulfatase-like hydrolase/transferase [Mariniflexile gromovii]MBP0902985.1 sulfatase-like hydrolase/transferase [Mariniflexile gromovii]